MIAGCCIHNISDDDCERCEVFGYLFDCGGCEEYSHTWEVENGSWNEEDKDKCSVSTQDGKGQGNRWNRGTLRRVRDNIIQVIQKSVIELWNGIFAGHNEDSEKT